MDINEYTIIVDENITTLIKRVNNYIATGWWPLGGVVKSDDGYLQTLVKK